MSATNFLRGLVSWQRWSKVRPRFLSSLAAPALREERGVRHEMDISYEIRTLRESELPKVLRLRASKATETGQAVELLNWYKFDPSGFFAAVSRTGEILGTCSGIRLTDDHASAGMHLVRPDLRGNGLGQELFRAVFEHMGQRNIAIYATTSAPWLRDVGGFTHVADWASDFYKLDACALRRPIRRQLVSSISTKPLDSNRNQFLLPDVVEFDRKLHGYDRSRIVGMTLGQRTTKCQVALQGDKVVGYGCLTLNLRGLWMVAPLYADSEKVARRLLCELLGSLNSSELAAGVGLWSPLNNGPATTLLTELGFQRQGYNARSLFNLSVRDTPTEAIFAYQSVTFGSE